MRFPRLPFAALTAMASAQVDLILAWLDFRCFFRNTVEGLG
jgi:hypothetical protein